MSREFRFAKLLATTSVLLWNASALAQDAAEEQVPEGSLIEQAAAPAEITQEDDERPTDIVVTAQRRSESIQDVPVSLTVVTDEMLETRRVNDVSQINQVAPSVQFAGGDDFSMRGVGTLSFTETVESSVGLTLDDVSLGRSGLGLSTFQDVARIEALSGPQGLLFGKNASAGLLNIVTRRPELGRVGGAFDLELNLRDTTPGNSMGAIARGTLNVPIGSNAALRFNTHYTYQNSPVEHLRVAGDPEIDINTRDYGARMKFLMEPADDWEIYVIGEYNETRGRSPSLYRELAPGSGVAAVLENDGIEPGPNNFYFSSDADTLQDTKRGGLQASVTHILPNDWEIINIAAWKYLNTRLELDTDFTSIDFLNINSPDGKYDQFSNELRLAIPARERINGQVGLYYFWSRDQGEGQLAGNLGLPFAPPPGAFFLGRDVESETVNKSYAAFGQFNFRVAGPLQLLAGARITHDEVSIETSQMKLAAYLFIPLAEPGDFQDDTSNTNVSWKFGAQYDVNADVMVYGFAGRGYKGPGYNNVVEPGGTDLVPVNAETNMSYEFGFKSSWFNRRLVFNASAFLQKFSDYQAQTFDTNLQTFLIQNAAELTSKGIEAQIIARPLRNLTLNAGATLLDAKFGNFPGAQCYPGQPDAECVATGSFNARGLPLPGSAKFSSTVQALYEFPLTGVLDGFVETNWYHRSSINFSQNNAPLTRIGPADVIGASVGIQNERMRLSLFCKNCTDRRIPEGIGLDAGDATLLGAQTSLHFFGLNSVRTLGLAFGYEF